MLDQAGQYLWVRHPATTKDFLEGTVLTTVLIVNPVAIVIKPHSLVVKVFDVELQIMREFQGRPKSPTGFRQPLLEYYRK